jgi:hypothetical protein
VRFSGTTKKEPVMLTDREKAEEILKKRRLAAKGLEERSDGKPIDPMENVGTLDIDNDPDDPDTAEERELEVADRAIVAGLALKP